MNTYKTPDYRAWFDKQVSYVLSAPTDNEAAKRSSALLHDTLSKLDGWVIDISPGCKVPVVGNGTEPEPGTIIVSLANSFR